MIIQERRGVFAPLLKKKARPIRPPYALSLEFFDQVCFTCKDKACSTVCEETIIFIDEDGLPKLDFKESGCTFCKECAKACIHGVLDSSKEDFIDAKVTISSAKCLAWNGTMCFTCKDSCEANAIEFFGVYRPVIKDNCTACGFCKSPCPVDAIEIKGVKGV